MSSNSLLKKLPMCLTLSRILVLPPILICIYLNSLTGNIAAAILFILASITDYLDGRLARKYNAVTTMGKFMDPIADKILVSGVLIMFVARGQVDPIMVIIILCRDIFIDGMRAVAAVDQIIIAAKPLGKWKAALQMIAIPEILLDITIASVSLAIIGYWTLWVSVLLSIVSAGDYFYGYLRAKGKTSAR
jgi:CDP-diacylglycerol--glycerol-3-phosphate 3-phosphatidyltransferase